MAGLPAEWSYEVQREGDPHPVRRSVVVGTNRTLLVSGVSAIDLIVSSDVVGELNKAGIRSDRLRSSDGDALRIYKSRSKREVTPELSKNIAAYAG